MDELVLQAMARWPDVPAVFGWLRLDRRGRWMLVDRGMPGFDERVHGMGSQITSPQIIEFIGRNYAHDDRGRWFWQNGPQRVFVDTELAPWVLRVLESGASARLITHTGAPVDRIECAWRTPEGDLILLTDLGPGAVHDLDLAALDLEEVEAPTPAAILTLQGRRFEVQPLPPAPERPWRSRPRD